MGRLRRYLLLTAAAGLMLVAVATIACGESEDSVWREATAANTVEAFEAYLEGFCQNSGRQCRGDGSRFVIGADYAAAISAVSACHLDRKTRRLSDKDIRTPMGGRMRKYWRSSSNAEQKRFADSIRPNPSMG